MGNLTVFEIIYDNPQAVYHAGQPITGHVTVELNAPKKMKGIHLRFHGKAKVHWTETQTVSTGKSTTTVTRCYSSSELYFDQVVVLFGKAPGEGGPDPELPAGHYTYPFQFNLTPNLPSSFEGQWGHVRYYAKATIDRPWNFDHDTKKCFTVLSVLDLNREPLALNPQENSDEKFLCCLCCKNGPITGCISLPRTGYVPGESITVNAHIRNHSSRKMDKSSLKLSQKIAFHATTKTRRTTNLVASMVKGEIAPNSEDEWINAQLKIPPIPPSNLVGCKIIDINYVLTLEVDPSGPSLDLDIPLSVLIGTIPPQPVVAAYYAGGNYDLQHARRALASHSKVPPMLPADPSMLGTSDDGMLAPPPPPPSYESCVYGPTNVKDEDDNDYTMGNLEYTPAYTYYDWNKHTV